VYLLVDGSQSMAELDLKPTRIEFSLKLLTAFVDEFFDQNPLSQMGIILTRDGLAEKILDLTGNPSDLKEALSKKNLRDTQGDASLQNSLELAVSSLCHVPSHGSREIISVYASLSTCDPSDISKTLSVLKKEKVRVSIVGLAAEVQICKRICEETSGNYGVILDDAHYRELLFLNVSPPALDTQTARSSMIRMGFPPRDIFKAPQLCSWYGFLEYLEITPTRIKHH
jgi:transcription initiation factor TFIIH subunit 2